jgi:hypothetical protein
MNDLQFELLNSSDPAAVQEYETAFYQAFARVTTNRLVQKLWLWDHETARVKTRVHYQDQLICTLRDQTGRLRSAMAFNVKLQQFQGAAYGFAAPPVPSVSFEVLTFFASAAQTLAVCAKFWSGCLALLSGRGLTTGYATTAPRPLPMYRRAGWRVLQEQEIESEKRYFLRYEIPRFGQRDGTAQPTLGYSPRLESRSMGSGSDSPALVDGVLNYA